EVAALELGPALRFVGVPLPERRARGHLLRPLVDAEVILPDAARPQPVDQDAVSIGTRRGLVGPFQLHRHVTATSGTRRGPTSRPPTGPATSASRSGPRRRPAWQSGRRDRS